MEPLNVHNNTPRREALADLELTVLSTGLRRSLPAGVVTALANLVRAMNCCYSNLIVGHDTIRSISNVP